MQDEKTAMQNLPHGITPLVLGAIGGILPDVLRILKVVRSGQPVTGVFGWRLWVSLIILVPIGAFVAWLLDASSAMQALACGFSGPDLLSKILSDNSNLPPIASRKLDIDRGDAPLAGGEETGPPGGGLRTWWAI